jgi:sugar lactone lactonase YvrE
MLPAQNPTATTFAGSDLSTLIVTSARFGMENPADADGAMMAVQTDVIGQSENRFVP